MDKYINFFINYIYSYNLLDININRKKEHTFNVIENCEKIAKSLNLSDNDVLLAKIIGLFHDIGRFKQYEIYNKFRDYETIDHAILSVKIIKESHVLDDYEYKDIALIAIKNHNKLLIEDGLDERTLLFCKIIRDADKIDILRRVIMGNNSYENGGIKIGEFNSKYNHNVIKDIINGKCINPGEYNDLCDKSLVKLGLFNDINFDYSKKYIIKNNMIDKIKNVYIKSNPIDIDSITLMCKAIEERLGR